jgi:hypothetical protein
MQNTNGFLTFFMKQEHRIAETKRTRRALLITSPLNRKEGRKEKERRARKTLESFLKESHYVGVFY